MNENLEKFAFFCFLPTNFFVKKNILPKGVRETSEQKANSLVKWLTFEISYT